MFVQPGLKPLVSQGIERLPGRWKRAGRTFACARKWRRYPRAMAKSQDKKRNDKKNKAKLTPKEKKLRKAAKAKKDK